METAFFLVFPVCVSSVSFHTRESCPNDVVEWNNSKHRFNCSKTEVYHCLLDERNRSGEFCSSDLPSWVEIDHCPRYNGHSGRITTERCYVHQGCPTEAFPSNKVYKYQACLKIKDEKPTVAGVDDSFSPWPIVIGISVAVVVIVSVIAIVCCIRRRQKPMRQQEMEEKVTLLLRKEPPFYNTSVFHEAVRFLQNGGKFLCFHGRWGSGKTTTAKQVYLSVTGRKPVVIENISVFDVSSCDDCVIIEEPISKHLPNLEVENIMSKIKTLCSKIEHTKDSFAIFISSDEEWKRFSDEIKKTLLELEIEPLLDICLNYDNLTPGDRNQILHSIFGYHNPTAAFRKVENVATCNESHLGYAETCTLLSRCSALQTNPGAVLFSNRPLLHLKSHFKRMCTSSEELERYKFLILVFMSLNEKQLDLNKETRGLRNLFKACDLPPKNVELTSIIPDDFVLREDKDVYVLQHDVIQRMVLVVFGTHHFEKLVRFSSWNMVPDWIRERTTLETISKKAHVYQEIQPILEISHEQLIELRKK